VPRLPGLGPDSAFARLVERVTRGHLTPRGTRVATFMAALVLAFGILGMLGFVQVSSTPRFCGTCHIMKPYYDSWKHSTHGRIACVECHISPGVTAEIHKKFEALSMVAKYFTATYGTKPWAEVDDAACLRCHQRRLLEGEVDFNGVAFDHTPHLTETRRGMKLRCTSCHGQIVQGTHITVTSSTCALCHFKGQPANQGLGRCTRCHDVPERRVAVGRVNFDHAQVKTLGMDCRSCHAGIVQGKGEVPEQRCVSCHNQPERLAEFGNTELLHRKHVTEHKVDCNDCHMVIEHAQQPPTTTAAATTVEDAGTCGACHGAGHSAQQLLYEGRGGRGVPVMPGPMAAAGVTCEGCHNAALAVENASAGMLGVHTLRSNEVACMSCHGPDYRDIFFAWKSSVDERVAALRRQLDATVGAMGVSPPQAFEDARANFLLVERGHGVHNVNYSYALLDKAWEQMNEARRSKGLGPMPRPWTMIAPGSAACLNCHVGIEKQAGTFAGRAFAHAPHLQGAKLDCAACHRPHAERAPGEVVRFGPSGCVPCHHSGKAAAGDLACARCHGDVRKGTVTTRRGEFSHAAHLEQGLECRNCHEPSAGDPRPARGVCAQCHTD
jgi:nitrate/TMAO reductase-like tetraheme cytochrome c subunit